MVGNVVGSLLGDLVGLFTTESPEVQLQMQLQLHDPSEMGVWVSGRWSGSTILIMRFILPSAGRGPSPTYTYRDAGVRKNCREIFESMQRLAGFVLVEDVGVGVGGIPFDGEQHPKHCAKP